MTGCKNRHANGFTLVEVALALLVISIGLLTVFALFPAAMQSNKQALDDTAAALFAQEVFNGLRAEVNRAGFNWNDVTSIELTERASHMYEELEQQHIYANTLNLWDRVYYIPNAPGSDGLVDQVLRYRLTIRIDPQRPDIASIILEVVPGEHGFDDNPVTFYTELINPA